MRLINSTYLRYLSSVIAAVSLLLPLVSCSNDSQIDPIVNPDDLSQAKAGLYISVGDVITDQGDTSRASGTPVGDYDSGEGYENFIDLDEADFAFYFFDIDDSYVAGFKPTSVVPVSGDAYSKRYYVSGVLDARRITGTDFKVLVLANWGDYPEPVVGQKLSTILSATEPANIYAFTEAHSQPSEEHPIPLFGINFFPGIKFVADQNVEIGTIHLLRAYSKITVTNLTPEWEVRNIVLTRYNTSGLKAPLGVNSESGYVKGSYDADYVDAISLPHGVTSGRNLKFERTSVVPPVYTVYVPEYRNVATAGATTPLSDCARIWFNLDGATEYDNPSKLRDFYVDFMYYDGPDKGKYFDIKRNYWYNFDISKSSENFDMTVVVDVIPFSEVKLKPDFGLERDDISGYIIVRDPITKKILYWRDSQGNKWYIVQDGETRYVFVYDDKDYDNLDHWFDYTGVKHDLTPDGVSGYDAVYDQTFEDQLLYWETGDGHKVWLVMNEYFSVYVYDYVEGGPNPSGNALYWYDFLGIRHEMTENEDEVLEKWKDFLTGNF